MLTQQTPDAILIGACLPNLTDGDIEPLRDAARFADRHVSTKYGRWITSLLDAELARRAGEGNPVDAALSSFGASRWTGAQLADALVASYGVLDSARDHPGAHDLLDKLDQCLRGWTVHRLRKIG